MTLVKDDNFVDDNFVLEKTLSKAMVIALTV